MTEHLEQRLRYNVLFEDLSDEVFDMLRPVMRDFRVKAGDMIIRDGSIGEDLYLIVSGRVKIVKETADGHKRLLALLHPGDFFGELELVDGRPRSAHVIAADHCLLYTLPAQEFDCLIQQSHPFARRLLQTLSLRFRTLTTKFMQDIETSRERLAVEIRNFEQIIEAAKKVNSTLDLDRVLEVVLDTAMNLVECERGTLYLLDDEKKEIWSKVLKDNVLREIRLPMGKGIAGYVAATGDVMNITDAYADPRFNPEIDRKSGYRTRSILCVPLRNPGEKIIGVFQLINKREGVFTRNDEGFIRALSVHGAIAIENARLHEAEKRLNRINEEVRLAAVIQMDLLPKSPPSVPGYDIAARTIPARSVGGDYFDFIPIDETRIAVCVGDVSGKGLPASLLMANVQATLRGQAFHTREPGPTLERSNELLFRSTSSEKFVTLFYGVLDFEGHQLSYANGGHEDPVVMKHDGSSTRLPACGPPVAILESYGYPQNSITVDQGAVMAIYTDGISEAMNIRREQYGVDRVVAALQKHHAKTAAGILDGILEDVAEFVGSAPQMDDMTMMVVKRLPQCA
jgi:sigma-B regulation protein RsbU (phosphoserine phosphatase)